jgi:hypothetical protein
MLQSVQSFFDRILPREQGKRDLAILLLIVVPLIVIGFTWAELNGGYAEPIPPATPSVIATPGV